MRFGLYWLHCHDYLYVLAFVDLWPYNDFQVIPSEFGTPRPWHFPITDVLQTRRSQQEKRATNGGIDDSTSMVLEDADGTRGRYQPK